MKSKLISIYASICYFFFTLSSAIAVPILFRPFYYLNVKLLNIVENSGYSIEIIKQAYNEMLDYCIGLSSNFSVGELAYTQEGMNHFTDCRYLFILDFVLLAISLISLIAIQLFEKKRKIQVYHFQNHSCACQAARFMIVFFVSLTLLALVDFDSMFTLFHKVFFPGKSNWIFDYRYDQIINILPEAFFANCALLIVVIIVILCIMYIKTDKRTNEK